MLGLYIHVPFCAKICDYCDFHAFPAPEWLKLEYLDLVSREVSVFAERHPGVFSRVETLYVGGGTPSMLTPDQMARFFGIFSAAGLDFGRLKEATFEFNPESCDGERLAVARECGITRASLGLQSLHQHLLDRVGRHHDVQTGKRALDLLLSRKNLRVNADLMFDLPGQTLNELLEDVEWLAGSGVGHISLYGLKVDPTRRLGIRVSKGLETIDEDLYAEMYLKSVETLEKCGFSRYETSNFARGGEESLHNLNYWNRGEYLAFGPSAHGFYEGVRFYAPERYAKWREYVKNGCPREGLTLDSLTPEDVAAEYVQLSLRTKYGMRLQTLENLGFRAPDAVLEKWVSEGFAELSEGVFRLVGKGWIFMDTVVLDIYSKME
ncbi:MAG: radical SAM family heme chaperone HemW [Fibrobacter sp.]|nr:radical SAM family heme chaperone HemW [Fibrobacter sp.]